MSIYTLRRYLKAKPDDTSGVLVSQRSFEANDTGEAKAIAEHLTGNPSPNEFIILWDDMGDEVGEYTPPK